MSIWCTVGNRGVLRSPFNIILVVLLYLNIVNANINNINGRTINSNNLTNEVIIESNFGKIYERCELVHELDQVHQLPMDQIPTWICIAEHESQYNTAAIGHQNTDGSLDHGLFQISDLYWCSHNIELDDGTANVINGKGCALDCQQLRDNNLVDDVDCIQRIYREHSSISGDGFNAWSVYKPYCREQTYEMISDCFDSSSRTSGAASAKTTKDHNALSATSSALSSSKDFIEYNGNNPLYNKIKASLLRKMNPQEYDDYKRQYLQVTSSDQSEYKGDAPPKTANRKVKTNEKIYTKCALAQELYRKYHFQFDEIPIWLCIAEHLSNYNTAAISGADVKYTNSDNSYGKSYGLFQISDKYWCSSDKSTLNSKACHVLCDQLADSDISDDIKCIRIIHEKHSHISGDGFDAWTVYQPICKNSTFSDIRQCFTGKEILKYEKNNSSSSSIDVHKENRISSNPFFVKSKKTNNPPIQLTTKAPDTKESQLKSSKIIKSTTTPKRPTPTKPTSTKSTSTRSTSTRSTPTRSTPTRSTPTKSTVKKTTVAPNKATTTSKPPLSAWAWLLPRLTLIKPKTQS